jgi:hypothetical protein
MTDSSCLGIATRSRIFLRPFGRRSRRAALALAMTADAARLLA